MRDRLPSARWLFVAVAAAAMGAAGTYQFVWSSIRPALGQQVGASEAALGTVFTVYVVAQTLSQFPAGRFRDRHGPRLPIAAGAVLLAVGYVGTGLATAVWQAYLFYAVGGVGAGAVYTVAVNTPVKWFTDRRGLATGAVTMAYGGVSVLFIPYVRGGLAADFGGTLAVVAAVTGGVSLLGAAVLRDPDRDAAAADGGSESGDGDGDGDGDERGATGSDGAAYGWRETVRTWQFWVLYAMFVVVNGVGLMLIGKAVAFAEQFGLSAAVATGAASVVALSDSAGIVTVGGLSDRLGRERTVAATVSLCGVAVAAAVWAGAAGRGPLFVALLGAAAFFRSPVFSVVPALVGEYYGAARSSENYALLYTAKVWGGVVGGVAASLLIAAVGWSTAFLLGAAAMTGVGLLSGLLRPVE
ncbi:MAG: MFS transporter [Halobacteriaceae archaeon]